MGGKHNLANRTKNNARPSNSGRSAAMLNSSLPQFGGFSGIKEPTGLSTFTFGPVEEFDPSVEECFQLVIKKISKKDSTTKLKGLQEFAELVKNADPDAVKAILPIWPRFYSVLATDPDNRVREATHNVHHEIVKKVKRNIAPFLKQIMAPWFTSQYDNYPPAATAAVQAFKDTFSETKFQEAIIFCQDEILCYIYENLSVQLDQIMAGNTILTQEAEAKYERILISCLQGYSLYLQKVPIENIKISADSNSKIVLNDKFWKLASSKIFAVRSAWFQVLSVILQKAVFLLKDKESQILNTTLNYMDDDEPVVLPHVWECVLLETSVIPDWWKYINVEKLLIPKLLKVLRKAGQGNAIIIYPNLLPLLSNLPPMDKENEAQFYKNFFEAMRVGLKLKSVASSKSESTAIAAAFIECLQFLIIKKSTDIDLCKSLLKDQLISTIERCVTDENPCYKGVFHQTSLFVQYLSRNDRSILNESLVSFFFEQLQEVFSALLRPDLSTTNILQISERQIELVRALKQISRPKRDSHVQFIEDDKKPYYPKRITESLVQNESYSRSIERLAVKLFQGYANYVTANSSKDLVDQMCSLLMDFDKNVFFDGILAEMKISYMDIYENLFKKWLISENIYCKSVINLIFTLMTYLQEEEIETILNDLTNSNQPDCLMWSVSTALSYPHVENDTVKKWLKEEKIGSFFVSIAEKQIINECSPELGVILKLALTEDRNGDLFVTKNVLSKIIENISSTLLDGNDTVVNLDSCASLAAHLCSIIYTESLQLTYGDKLLLTLVEITCKYKNESDMLSSETIWEIKSAWQDAVVILLSNLDDVSSHGLVEEIVATIEKQFYLALVTNQEQMEHLADVIVICNNAFYQSTTRAMSSLVELVFKKPWMIESKTLEKFCQAAEYVHGNMGCTYHKDFTYIDICESLKEKEILQCFIWRFVKLYVLCSKLNIGEQSDNEEYTHPEAYEDLRQMRRLQDIDSENISPEADQSENEECIDPEVCEDSTQLRLLDIINSENNLLEALYFYSMGEAFLIHFKNVKYYKEIMYYNSWVGAKLQEIFSNMDENMLAKVKAKLKNKCITHGTRGWFWCRAASTLYVDFLKVFNYSSIYSELMENVVVEDAKSTMHIEHIFKNDDRAFFASHGESDVLTEMIGKMEKLRNENTIFFEHFFIYDDTKDSWEKVEQIIKYIRLSSNIIKCCPLPQTHWDSIVISLTSWVGICLKARAQLPNLQYQSMLVALSRLYITICVKIAEYKEENVNTTRVNEWEDVLLESIHADFVHIWFYIAGFIDLWNFSQLKSYSGLLINITKEYFENTSAYPQKTQDCYFLEQFSTESGGPRVLSKIPFIQYFGPITEHLKYEFIFKTTDNYPKWTKFFKISCNLLTNSSAALQLCGYRMLKVLIPGLVKIDTEAVDTSTPHKKGLIFEQFKEKLTEVQNVVNSMLMDFRLGENTCRVEPSYDSFTYTFAYLLLWDVMLCLCEEASAELRYQYTDWLKNGDFLQCFLSNIFKLISSDILHYSEVKSKTPVKCFLERPLDSTCYSKCCNGDTIEQMVCYLYKTSLVQLPALVRQWWTDLDTKASHLVDKITTLYVAPHLCTEELNDVMQYHNVFKNMKVKVMPGIREILAVYTVDETQMELTIILPVNYPLGSPTVNCNKQISGANQKQWLLQFKKCVLHQNGRIWDGLALWNNNLDKKFDGVEECFICYAVLHYGTCQLPRLSCQTCKKKFHSACLYKWFSTSNKSSCPICRNLF